MRVFLAVFLIAVFAGHANALEWMSRDSNSTFSNAPDGDFYLWSEDMMEGPLLCEIVNWPISEAVGSISCAGYGETTEYTIEIKNDTTLILGGYEYYRVD